MNSPYDKPGMCFSADEAFRNSEESNPGEDTEQSSVEIRLFNHNTDKALYKKLTTKELEHILQVLPADDWI